MKKYDFNEFMNIIRQLRSENGCPWDREQTHDSLKTCMIEECYEVIDAINQEDVLNLREELGDVLLQVALHSAIAEEQNEFCVEDVIQEVSEKMIRRHPHVFQDVEVKDSGEVIRNWEEIKRNEKKEQSVSESIQKIPKAFPSTIRAEKVQKKAAKAGLEFEDYDQVLSNIYEKLNDLKKIGENKDLNQFDDKIGDLMFSIVNLSRFLQINAENSLTNATDKFINRFVGIERVINGESKDLSKMSIDEFNALWGRAKESE
jgi:MazG family protein